ncbi:tRNA glutamyl-Q(34) synthetase GluQRS [Sphingomonas turrisvirgatae]|uniref:tRNA glutamyl-Q(34) synthetase GluQRS n=1 Tax=Sphingomonas turrisvirgatae TaxID=1888892 RepID=A0A1E3LYL5_9SPHN|nr:tRNA glutamyl-Q(34) synthetase GluQRS [Sphingomonas turrisvirgatae]ODP38195.1 tRNA glutamyl-Q(34) synthetase GluQRS [Sphingomonas turrisvirgatae]
MTIVTRFAPSPTGRLHAGHAFSAIQAHDFARSRGGRFLLRIEDIDGTRSRPEHVETILADLRWLGLAWDGAVLFQSQRLPIYQAALDDLRARGLLYPCFCTRADIAASMTAPHGPEGAIYPGTCRARAAPDLARPHCWRLDMAGALAAVDQPLFFHDSRRGLVDADPLAHGDVVLARKDAPASYHLAVTLDDAAQGVTDVVRGADLLPATHVHRLLQALLGLPTPRYHHHALLAGTDGQRLAKRHGAPTLSALRERGVDGSAFADALRQGELPVGFGVTSA